MGYKIVKVMLCKQGQIWPIYMYKLETSKSELTFTKEKKNVFQLCHKWVSFIILNNIIFFFGKLKALTNLSLKKIHKKHRINIFWQEKICKLSQLSVLHLGWKRNRWNPISFLKISGSKSKSSKEFITSR